MFERRYARGTDSDRRRGAVWVTCGYQSRFSQEERAAWVNTSASSYLFSITVCPSGLGCRAALSVFSRLRDIHPEHIYYDHMLVALFD